MQKQWRYIRQLNVVVSTVIKGHTICKVYQFTLVFVFWNDTATIVADVVVECLLFRRYLVRHLVWSTFTWRNLDDENRLSVNLLYIQSGLIVRAHQVVITHHILLDRLYLVRVYANNRSYGMAVLFLNSHHDIAATCFVKVIGECTDGTVDSIRVPSRLVFDAVTFYCSSAQKLFYVDG